MRIPKILSRGRYECLKYRSGRLDDVSSELNTLKQKIEREAIVPLCVGDRIAYADTFSMCSLYEMFYGHVAEVIAYKNSAEPYGYIIRWDGDKNGVPRDPYGHLIYQIAHSLARKLNVVQN